MAQCCSSPTSGCSSQGLQILEDVKEYYGKYLKNSKDLKTNACVTPAKPVPAYILDALKEVHSEVSSRYYGCGLVVPECLENCSILDLGSGSGRDCYMLSKLVGQKGYITGLDMTDEQVEVSRKYIDYHMKKFGYQEPNINFVNGYIEDLKSAGIKDQSYDIIISNCVINLSPDKKAVLREAYRVLKDGGEMYFSDVYSDKQIPSEIKQNKVLWGECISGALYWDEMYQIAEEIGFSPPRLVTSSDITVNNKDLEEIIGDYKFVSATFRLFKLPEDSVKEKGQVIYNGGITGCESEMQFDANVTFKEGEAVEVDEELWSILKSSRFSDEFLFQPAGKASCCQKKKDLSASLLHIKISKLLHPGARSLKVRAIISKFSTIIRVVESHLEQLTEHITEEEQEVRNLDKENKEKKHLEGKSKEKEIIKDPFQLAKLPQSSSNSSCCGPKGCC